MPKIHGIIQDWDFEDFFESHPSIRFVGVCTMQGKLLDCKFRNGVTPLLSDRGLQFAAVKCAIRAVTRIGDNENIGNPIYSVTAYENIKRATIPFGENLLLLVSFEKNQKESKVMKKVLDILNSVN